MGLLRLLLLGFFVLMAIENNVHAQNSDTFELILNETEAEIETEPATATLPDITTISTPPTSETTSATAATTTIDSNNDTEPSTTASNTTTMTATTTTTSTTTTTTTATTTTTTTTTSPKPTTESKFDYTNSCTCDLTLDSCDINCCCDPDCSRNDTQAFSSCIEQKPMRYDPKYCFNEQFVFWNSSQYVLEQRSEDLFCIYYDNQEERHRYLERAATENITEFRLLESRHRRFQWSSARQQSAARAMETYTVGRPLWVRYSGLDTLGFLELPVPFTSELCQTSSPVQFMRDRQSSCLVDMETADCEQDDILNANSYFQPFSVVASPKLFAQRDGGVGNSSQQGVFLPVTAHACRGDVCEAVTSFPAPTSSCENLVQRVQYVVHHEGAAVRAVAVFIQLSAAQPGEKYLRQHHGYQHFWARENVTEPLTELSGNPGYLVGKPVRAGLYMASSTTEMEAVIMEDNTLVSTFSVPEDGLCQFSADKPRVPLEFGLNKRIGCSIYVNKTTLSDKCSEIKEKSFHMMTGVHFNKLKEYPTYVATFGNSDVEKPGDWVRVMHKNEPDYRNLAAAPVEKGKCPGLVKSVHIEVVHASVGTLAHPQTKILGLLYNFGALSDEVFACVGRACQHRAHTRRLDFSVSVSHTDVSRPAAPVFAAVPVLQAKFPHDFFYPFVSSAAAADRARLLVKFCPFVTFTLSFLVPLLRL